MERISTLEPRSLNVAVRPRPVADLTFAIPVTLGLSKIHTTMRSLEIYLINLISYFINSGDLNAPKLH